MRPNRLLIFDVDGTLYQLPGGSFHASPLRQRIERNALRFIAKRLSLSPKQSRLLLQNIRREYGEDISVALKQKYYISFSTYFTNVWNVSTKSVVYHNPVLRPMLARLGSEYRLIVISDAPRIWINKVLDVLDVTSLFQNNIFSGDGEIRKGQKNTFTSIAKKLGYRPSACVVVGDQVQSDIKPAHRSGMKSVFVHPHKRSLYSTFNISSILDLESILRKKSSITTKD